MIQHHSLSSDFFRKMCLPLLEWNVLQVHHCKRYLVPLFYGKSDHHAQSQTTTLKARPPRSKPDHHAQSQTTTLKARPPRSLSKQRRISKRPPPLSRVNHSCNLPFFLPAPPFIDHLSFLSGTRLLRLVFTAQLLLRLLAS